MARDKLVLTYQDYLQMPEDRNRREILEGDLYVTPAPSPRHQRVVANLSILLEGYLSQHHAGKLYPSPIDVVLSQINVVQPDLVVVTTERLHIVTTTSIQGPPDLVIEVLSPSTAPVDRGRKLETYARFGVPEYWIVDPDLQALEIYNLHEGAYELVPSRADPRGPRSPLLPDLAIETRTLWD